MKHYWASNVKGSVRTWRSVRHYPPLEKSRPSMLEEQNMNFLLTFWGLNGPFWVFCRFRILCADNNFASLSFDLSGALSSVEERTLRFNFSQIFISSFFQAAFKCRISIIFFVFDILAVKEKILSRTPINLPRDTNILVIAKPRTWWSSAPPPILPVTMQHFC